MESATGSPSPKIDVLIPFDLPERKCQAQHDKLSFGTLCSACEALDVAALLAPAERDIAGELRDGTQLGTLPQIRDCSSHCPFCKVIVDQVPSVVGPEAIKPEYFEYKEHSRRMPAPIDHWKFTTSVPEPDEIVVSLRSFRGDMEQMQDLPMMEWNEYIKNPTATWLEILLHSGGPGFRTPKEGMAVTCQKRLVPCLGSFFTPKPLAGRIIPQQVRYSEMRSHLDVCLKNHDECFLLNFKSNDIEKHLWLIDTINKRIVHANQDAEYAALSYVWGGSRPKYTHFKDFVSKNIGILPQINSIVAGSGEPGMGLPQDLPATISDAIDFCRGLEIRFLWVDSICIDQDSQEMKDYLVSRMDSIYMRAKVTIIAAAGEDANAGLPGVSSQIRVDGRTTVSLQGIEFTTSCLPAKQLIVESAWWKRAWTFQEGWLSPRCFIFTPQEILFCCTQSTNRESLHSCSPRFRNGLATRVFQTHEIGFPTGIGQINEEGRVSSLFNSVLRLYHRRQLTFKSDRIKAVQGCINTIAEQSGIPSWNGMPMQWGCIAGALIWRHMKPAKRTNLEFPSYSWASWDAEPVYFREFNIFDDGFAKIDEGCPEPGIPAFSSGCPRVSFTGDVAQLHIKPGVEDAWCLNEEKHSDAAPGWFGDCYLGKLSPEEVQRLSTGPSEFLGIAKGVHYLSNQDLVMGMMIERKGGYVVRRTVLCVTGRVWKAADRVSETLLLV
jgi:hypothetical protein